MRSRKLTSILATVIISLVALTGCGAADADEDLPVHTAVVIGNHANSRQMPYNRQEISEAIAASTLSVGQVFVISNDGEPALAGNFEINAPKKGISDAKRQKIADAQAEQICQFLTSVAADNEESDLMGAINIGVRELRAAGSGIKNLVIADNCLPTTGELNFRNGLISADPAAIVAKLKANGALPDFTDLNIVVIGCGEVQAPQKDLSSKQRNDLIGIWKEIFIAGNASYVQFIDISCQQNMQTDLPYVSVVDLPDGEVIRFEQPVVFHEDQVAFISDSAEFLNPAAAEKALYAVAKSLQTDTWRDILIVGTTAEAGPEENCITLSYRRAETVKKALVNMGVSEKRINTLGLGYNDPWHLPDQDNEENAAANRKVVILSADSDVALNLLTK